MVVNWALPLDERFTAVNVWSYSVKGNGSDTVVTQSSQWLPMSVVPGTIPPPICMIEPQDVGVGVAVGVAVAVGVGVEEPDCAQYFPPVFKGLPLYPPQTII
jgi:hypothetical protein